MKKRIVFIVIFVMATFICGTSNAQTALENYSGRFIVIDDITTFFSTDGTDNSIVGCVFDLYNIYENESSKPAFVEVNDLSNVIQFGIKSHSDKYENRRSCTLQMNQADYLYTFRLVLYRMKVEKVFYNEELIDVNDFLKKIK